MIKSMTGFGRCEVSEGERKFTVEMKSVNHRYLDVNIKMPKKLTKKFKVDLQLFNDGGATGAEGSATATENAPKVETKQSGSNRRSKSGEFDNVVFGKQEGTTSDGTTSLDTEGKPTGAGKTDVTTTSDTLEERKKAFNDLINGEYKDLY